MSEISREALREHNYCMGIQIGTLIEALGMHWENQRVLMNGETILYHDGAFRELLESNIHVLTHNGIITQWQGVE